jgi:hypothetical protein
MLPSSSGWSMKPWRVVVGYRHFSDGHAAFIFRVKCEAVKCRGRIPKRFGRPCHLHLQGEVWRRVALWYDTNEFRTAMPPPSSGWSVTLCSVVVGYHRLWGPCCLHVHSDGCRKDLLNAGILPQHYTESQPRRPRLKSSSPWIPVVSRIIQTCSTWLQFSGLQVVTVLFIAPTLDLLPHTVKHTDLCTTPMTLVGVSFVLRYTTGWN